MNFKFLERKGNFFTFTLDDKKIVAETRPYEIRKASQQSMYLTDSHTVYQQIDYVVARCADSCLEYHFDITKETEVARVSPGSNLYSKPKIREEKIKLIAIHDPKTHITTSLGVDTPSIGHR